jgi:hypothetical protein
MKIITLFMLLFLNSYTHAQTGAYYVAAKSGLTIREKADLNAKQLAKIPYGTRIITLPEDAEPVGVNTEGLNGFWRKVKYNNSVGYIIDNYLLPWPPPKTGTRTMKEYITQITAAFGVKLPVKSGTMNNIEEGGWQLNKQLYKNGAEWQEFQGYEYGSDTWLLPDFSIQQAFVLIRLIPEFNAAFNEKELFPVADKTYKKTANEYEVKIEKEDLGGGFGKLIKKIHLEWADGAVYVFELYMLENQVVIFLGSGV